MSKRYVEIVEVDDSGNRTTISSKEEKKFSLKTAIADFKTNHPKVTKVVKVIGLVTAAAGVAAVGISIGKGKSKESEENDLFTEDDQKLLTESDTDAIPVENTEKVSDTVEEC